ncbi:MAG: hypothetical protein AAB425_00855 [Bdellovibrionota bacterium]
MIEMEVEAQLHQKDGNLKPCRARIQKKSERESFFSSGRRSLKIVGVISLCILPGAFIEPFLFLAWGPPVLVTLLFFVGPTLHGRFWSERVTLLKVEGACPNCGFGGKLGTYLSTKVVPLTTLLCAACGETCTVEFGADAQ